MSCDCCATILNCILENAGQDAHDQARQQIEPIHQHLVGLYPEHTSGLLDLATWPTRPRMN